MNSPSEFDTVAARFEAIRADADRTPDALVPRSIMRAIAAGLSRAPTLRRTNPLKSRQQRDLWGRLADEATARPEHVGFVLLGDGGLRELADAILEGASAHGDTIFPEGFDLEASEIFWDVKF